MLSVYMEEFIFGEEKSLDFVRGGCVDGQFCDRHVCIFL